MIVVRIGPDMRMAVVGSPTYFADRTPPLTPRDLAAHNCIDLRHTIGGGVSVWEFENSGRALNVRIEGQLVVNDIALARLGALSGAGLAYLPADYVEPHIASGDLVRVLESWCEPFPGYHLYYSSRRQPSAAFTLIVDALRYRG
jgi:DNA-binding transcriptional LysR family regulator